MNSLTTPALPSLSQLGKATAVALAAAGLILVTTVLPAEFGIDPTGAGKALGLTRLNAAAQTVLPAAPTGAAPAALVKSTQPLRSDTMSVTLQPGEGAEIKASMRKGETMVFNWEADGGPVKSDMHGEPHDAKPNEFTTYWKVPSQSNGAGSFSAPFDGIHGWFWRNKNDKPVTVKVSVSGFHDKLYRPAPQ
jgi:hypothetical protein